MDLTTARDWVRRSARDAGDTMKYADADIDRAILSVGCRFCRVTQSIKSAGQVNLTLGSEVADLSPLTTFRPERLLSARLVGKRGTLSVVPWDQLQDELADDAAQRRPERLAFETWTVANVWPRPDAAYALRLRWWEAFATFTPGTGTNPNLTIPDDYLAEILPTGMIGELQINEPEHGYAATAWGRYLEFEQSMLGAGNLGERGAERAMLAD
jgi:hypothetical protein